MYKRRLRTACDGKDTISSVDSVMAWVCLASNDTGSLVHIDLLMMWQKTEAAELMLKLIEIYCLLKINRTHRKWLDLNLIEDKKNENVEYLAMSSALNLSEQHFTFTREDRRQTSAQNIQNLKTAADKTWQSITKRVLWSHPWLSGLKGEHLIFWLCSPGQ